MQKKNVNVQLIKFLVALSLLFNFSCNTDELAKKEKTIQDLKNRILNDSLLLIEVNSNIKSINYTLDSVSVLHDELKNSKITDKEEALKRIKAISQVLFDKNKQVSVLEKEISKLESSLPDGYISESKKQIKIQLEYYQNLQKEISELKTNTINLNKIITEKDKELKKKDNTINKLLEEQTKQAIKLEKVKTDIIIAENEFEEAQLNTAKTYYSLSSDLQDFADKTSGIFAMRKKKMLINLAYEYYKKSYKLGYNKALTKITLFESEKKYYKYLDNIDVVE